MSEHTPGPWEIGKLKASGARHISGPTWHKLARVWCRIEDDERECPEGLANACLIAAAPELLAACKQILAMGYSDWGDKVMLEQVIAKAEGRDPGKGL